MKTNSLILLTFLGFTLKAQLPSTSFKELGFKKQVTKSEEIAYSFEDKVAEDKSSEIFEFNENGNLVKKSLLIFGKDGSETYTSYKYNEAGKVVAENTEVPKFPNFNAQKTFTYNELGQLIEKTDVMGKTYNKRYDYKLDSKGRISQEFGAHGLNSSRKNFLHFSRELYKTENIVSKSGKVQYTEYTLYKGGKTIAVYKDDEPKIKVYTYSANLNQELEFTFEGEEAGKQFKALDNLMITEYTDEKLNQLIKTWGEPVYLTKIWYKFNEAGDWIACYKIEKIFVESHRYVFRKIEYADGSSSGSSDFNISLVNELNSMSKPK